ncbi:MAG: hypothetical protein A2Y12_01620 [Planctomycetes bacterium GWF2_42_9]|nr:MAG: hypothetical protein A2Y12_01620 [Planctomycetes bacterium GWF2_42_9]
MFSDFNFDKIPLPVFFIFAVIIVLISIQIGKLLGQNIRRKPDHESESSLGSVIAATLGLLAFMLAFTFGITEQRYQARKDLLLEEVKAIETTYLRAQLLREPHLTETQSLLRKYVNLRANYVKEGHYQKKETFRGLIKDTEIVIGNLWSHARALADADRSSEIDALFISSLNNVIEIHKSRATVFQYRIPLVIWIVLYLITILSMFTVGYQEGLTGKKKFRIAIVLALTFSIVILLIADLDRGTGIMSVSQKPLYELQEKLNSQMPPTDANQLFESNK